jgi:Ca-activated chloride channel family protein
VLHELLTVRVRYRQPDSAGGAEMEVPFVDGGAVFADASGDFKFATAVAGFGLVLRDSPHKGGATFDQVLSWAEAGLKDDAEGHRGEFVELVRQARDLSGG